MTNKEFQEQLQEIYEHLLRKQHRDYKLDKIIEENIEDLYEE